MSPPRPQPTKRAGHPPRPKATPPRDTDTAWRDVRTVPAHWPDASEVPDTALRARTTGGWWSLLDSLGITLLLTREYEHFVLGLSTLDGKPYTSVLPLPHPSGLVADRKRGRVYIAGTRNPNQIMELRPCRAVWPRADRFTDAHATGTLLPQRTTFHPGSLYLHDLALIDGTLHGNAVGHNAIVRVDDAGTLEHVWWPRCIETPSTTRVPHSRAGQKATPDFSRNHLQLNSIAPGRTLRESHFSASLGSIRKEKPGDTNFPVDGTGVIFSGKTREPICTGLTRPHSARLHRNRIWVDNSGYGELGFVRDGGLETVVRLPGWTRGLCFCKGYAFVGTSRVLPRFHHYAPGLRPERCVCSVQAVCLQSGSVKASIRWPGGNQIFAIDWLPRSLSPGLPFPVRASRHAMPSPESLFYAYRV